MHYQKFEMILEKTIWRFTDSAGAKNQFCSINKWFQSAVFKKNLAV